VKPRDKVLKALLRESPGDVEAIVELLEFLIERQKWSDVERWIEHAERHAVPTDALLLPRAQLALARGGLDKAAALIMTASERFGDLPTVLRVRATVSMLQDRFDDALAVYRRLLTIDPNDDAAMLGALRTLLALERFEEAESMGADLVRRLPLDADAHQAYGQALAALDRVDRAKFHLERATTLDPEFGEARVDLAEIVFDEGREEDAMEMLERHLEEYGRDPVVVLALVDFYSQRGHFAEAADLLRRHLRDEPDDVDARAELAWMLIKVDRFDEAMNQARMLLGVPGENDRARRLLARCLLLRDKIDEAEAQLDEVEEQEEAMTLFLRSVSAYKRRDYEVGLDLASHALELDRSSSESLRIFGDCAFQLGLYEEARDAFKQLVDLGFDDAHLVANYAAALAGTGDHDRALAEIAKVESELPEAAKTLRGVVAAERAKMRAGQSAGDAFRSDEQP
jgi:tetratricopeptide (TPR) repeat protein